MSESAPNAARFRATVEYDGTAFHGSQLQPDVRTVQGEIEGALSRLFDHPTRIDLAGRTDTGVHAAAQEVAFAAPSAWDEAELSRALAAVLPDELRLDSIAACANDFHPRFDATGRRYEYALTTRVAGRPFLRDRVWFVERPLDLQALTGIADRFVGERSFAAFAKSGQPERGTRCRVESAAWRSEGSAAECLVFEIVADRFLHHMVRYIVGTSVEIATNARPEADVPALLEGGAASRAVYPAPPCGLYLTGVRYGDAWNREPGIPWLR